MLIDWFTVGAQALNFIILVWLMKRFLYKPILQAIDTREKRIADEIAAADAKKAEAQQERDEFQHKNENLDRQRASFLSKATDEAQVERQRLMDEARQSADFLRARLQETLTNDARNLNEAIRRRTQQEVLAIARKALIDLAGVDLERRMSEVFSARLRALNGAAKDEIASALKTATEPALVRSAFDLPPEEQHAINHALNETFSADIPLRFVTAPDLISGIELTANGRKVSWSIAGYLTSLEKGIDELQHAKNAAADNATPRESAPPAAPKAQRESEPATVSA